MPRICRSIQIPGRRGPQCEWYDPFLSFADHTTPRVYVKGNNARTFMSTNTVKKIYRIRPIQLWLGIWTVLVTLQNNMMTIYRDVSLRFLNLIFGEPEEPSTMVCDIIARPLARKPAQKLCCIPTAYTPSDLPNPLHHCIPRQIFQFQSLLLVQPLS